MLKKNKRKITPITVSMAAPDTLMVARLRGYRPQKTSFQTLFLTVEDFYAREEFVRQLDKVLWHGFHTHGKYMHLVRHAEYAVVAVDKNKQYVASAIVIPIGPKWLLEYVITDPKKRGKGAASAVVERFMREAKKAKVEWVILNCNSRLNSGQLPKFYSKFGFQKVA